MRYIKLSWLPLTYFHGHIETASWENNSFFLKSDYECDDFCHFQVFFRCCAFSSFYELTNRICENVTLLHNVVVSRPYAMSS